MVKLGEGGRRGNSGLTSPSIVNLHCIECEPLYFQVFIDVLVKNNHVSRKISYKISVSILACLGFQK